MAGAGKCPSFVIEYRDTDLQLIAGSGEAKIIVKPMSDQVTGSDESRNTVLPVCATSRQMPKPSKPRAKKPNNVKEVLPILHGYDSRGRGLYLRSSDNRLVYLECFCGKTSFKSILSLKQHVSDKRYHDKKRGFFRNQQGILEQCGKPGLQNEYETTISVSSLFRPTMAHAIEQGDYRLHRDEATSISSPAISSTTLSTDNEIHGAFIKVEENVQDPGTGMRENAFHLRQSSPDIEFERVPMPEYVSNMRHSTSDDCSDASLCKTLRQQPLAVQPELTFLDAGQTKGSP